MDVLVRPDLPQAHSFLEERLRGGASTAGLILLIGRCRGSYSGRAASRLDQGDRVVLIKRDGSFLLHGPTGFKPINWQPPGARFDVALDGAELVLSARRVRPPETVEVRFSRVEAVGLAVLQDLAPLEVSGTEFELRDLFRAHPDLIEPGFQPWARERLTDQGPIDLYGEDARGRRMVIELKRIPAGLAEATQLWRYVEAERKRRPIAVRGILVAPRISPRARQFLHEHDLEFLCRTWEEDSSREARRASSRQPSLRAFAGPAELDQTGKS